MIDSLTSWEPARSLARIERIDGRDCLYFPRSSADEFWVAPRNVADFNFADDKHVRASTSFYRINDGSTGHLGITFNDLIQAVTYPWGLTIVYRKDDTDQWTTEDVSANLKYNHWHEFAVEIERAGDEGIYRVLLDNQEVFSAEMPAVTFQRASVTRPYLRTGNVSRQNATVYFDQFQVAVDAMADMSILQDSGPETVKLAMIAAGADEIQPLKVVASSSNTGLIPHPTVVYTTADSTGTLTFAPIQSRHGVTTITTTVEDGGPDGNLNTASDNATFSRSFTVTVTPVNSVNNKPTLDSISDVIIPEDASTQTTNLTGIGAGPNETQPLKVTATSSNTSLIPNPTVFYS
ncbi:MAG: hypothetical protein GY888_08630, partial [Planctomycetaceae bacterium]|nr:hypothetical protein [Planctomycetaceae bacterium]